MNALLHFFVQYEYLLLFTWVFLEQLGLPVPSAPMLLAVGTLSVTHSTSISIVLLIVLVACLIADSLWFYLGMRFGAKGIRLLCKYTLETSACVSRTERAVRKQGPGALLIAKFVPGLNLMAPPLAGQSAMKYTLFLLYDAGGSLLWGTSLVLVGRFFGDAIQRHRRLFYGMSHIATEMFLLVVVAWILFKAWKKHSYLRSFRASRVEPEYLKSRLDDGIPVYIIDLRPASEVQQDPRVLPGAVRLLPEELSSHREQIPDDREIFTYCTCPNEKTSVRAALALQKMGFHSIHPVRGGFDAWKTRGYPLMEVPKQLDVT